MAEPSLKPSYQIHLKNHFSAFDAYLCRMIAGTPNMHEVVSLLQGADSMDVPPPQEWYLGKVKLHIVLVTRKAEWEAWKQGVWQGHTGVSTVPVPPDRSGVGLTGSRQTMFYAEVTEAHRGGPGGGLAEEGERIEVIHLKLDDAQAFADNPDIPKTLGVIYAISWFFSQVVPHLSLQ